MFCVSPKPDSRMVAVTLSGSADSPKETGPWTTVSAPYTATRQTELGEGGTVSTPDSAYRGSSTVLPRSTEVIQAPNEEVVTPTWEKPPKSPRGFPDPSPVKLDPVHTWEETVFVFSSTSRFTAMKPSHRSALSLTRRVSLRR